MALRCIFFLFFPTVVYGVRAVEKRDFGGAVRAAGGERGGGAHDEKPARGQVALNCHSPCASLGDPPKLPPRRSRLGALAYAAGSFEDMQASRPLRPSPRLPCARPRRAAHPLPRCTRSRHGRRPPRSPPLRVAGAQPRAGHLRIHFGEEYTRRLLTYCVVHSAPSALAAHTRSARRICVASFFSLTVVYL